MDTTPTSNHTENKEKKQPNTALKVVVLIGLIILLVVGILLPIKLVPNAVTSIKNGFTSLFGTDNKVTLLTDKKEIKSGEPFTLTWNGRIQSNGSYVFTYSCTPGVELQTSANLPNQTIPCDTPYYFSPTDNSITIVVITDNNQPATIPVNLGFLANTASETQTIGDTTLAVNNASLPVTPTPIATSTPNVLEPTTPATSTPATSTPSTPVVPNPKPTTPSTPSQPQAPAIADLAVNILSVTYPTQDKVIVKFNVTNIGTKNSGTWNLKASLPSATQPTYTAYSQKNLNPQDGIIYTLAFDRNTNSINKTVTITADYDNRVVESSNTNNTVTLQIAGNTPTSPSGKADLSVKSLKTGVLSHSGNFIETDSVDYDDKTAIQIEVVNNGTVATGIWKFTADLPTSGTNSFYTSSTQQSLAPGAKAILTLGYDLQEDYGNEIIVEIDSNDDVNESNESNNDRSVTLDID